MKAPRSLTFTAKFLLSFAALFAVAMPASADDIFSAEADTFISADNQDSNYGTATNLNVLGGGAGFSKDRYAFIRFNIGDYTGGTISNAFLTFIPQDMPPGDPGSASFEIYGINDGGASENFVETGLTLNNSGYDYVSADNEMDTSSFASLGSFTVLDTQEGQQYNFSSTALDAFLNSDANNIVTFVIVNPYGSEYTTQGGFFNKFDAREATSGGTTLTIVPEPASAALLLGLGVIATLGLKRRRA